MKLIIFSALLVAFGHFGLAAKIVCYYGSWAIYNVSPEDIDISKCNYINYAFVALTEEGNLKVLDRPIDIDEGGYRRTTALKSKQPNLKVLLSIGGNNATADLFSRVASNPEKRKKMVASARELMTTYNFDGIDIDWEVPTAKDKNNFMALLEEFTSDFNKNKWQITVAAHTFETDGYNISRMAQILEHINLMAYDFYGTWSNHTGQNSALYPSSLESEWEQKNLNLAAAVNNWIKAGASPIKLNAGIAFYGRTFTLSNPNNHNLHAPIKGVGKPGPLWGTVGSISYLEYCVNKTSWTCTFDQEQKNPYCWMGDQWVGLENEESIRAKVEFIKSKGLGGAMVWSVDQDDVKGQCGSSRPLLNGIDL